LITLKFYFNMYEFSLKRLIRENKENVTR